MKITSRSRGGRYPVAEDRGRLEGEAGHDERVRRAKEAVLSPLKAGYGANRSPLPP